MLAHHHVIEEENDDMEWQSEGERSTYSATGMEIPEQNISFLKISLV
jgi:hypothetical protein